MQNKIVSYWDDPMTTGYKYKWKIMKKLSAGEKTPYYYLYKRFLGIWFYETLYSDKDSCIKYAQRYEENTKCSVEVWRSE